MKVYSGYFQDEKKLLSSSSGGVATALSERIIQEGGCVFGVKYSCDFHETEYCCAETYKELEALKGSKYTKAKKGDIFKVLEEKIADGKTILFIGLGCDIAAVLAYCNSRSLDISKVFTVDILCHGPAVEGVHENYVLELEKKYHSKLKYFTIKYKKNGWTPYFIKAIFENGKEIILPFNGSDYEIAFRTVARPVCTNCSFKGSNHKGDLCIGDFWGIRKGAPGWNKNGVSLIIVQTPKGNELLDLLDESFCLLQQDSEEALKHNPLYFKSRPQGYDYDLFINDLNVGGLHYAVKQLLTNNLTFGQRVKTLAKRIIYR